MFPPTAQSGKEDKRTGAGSAKRVGGESACSLLLFCILFSNLIHAMQKDADGFITGPPGKASWRRGPTC
jgi:hypothetical protein